MVVLIRRSILIINSNRMVNLFAAAKQFLVTAAWHLGHQCYSKENITKNAKLFNLNLSKDDWFKKHTSLSISFEAKFSVRNSEILQIINIHMSFINIFNICISYN